MKEFKIDFYKTTDLKSYDLDATMRYQLAMLENLDHFTRVHSENVASLVCRICDYLKCKKDYIIYATKSAYIHDIGLLGVPASIVHKGDNLSETELERFKAHPQLGYEICMKDLKLRPYTDGVLYHHESLDGSGYPKGLTKKDIPYVAQIIRVADDYDHIVSKDNFTSHINISKALEKMIKDSKPEDYIKPIALNTLTQDAKEGKINPTILSALFKVVIDDTLYEICGVMDYVKYLKEQIKRLEQISKYGKKMEKCKSEKDINYYKEGMRILFKDREDFDNYKEVIIQYQEALIARQQQIKDLYNEVKIIKKLKV